MKIYYFQFVLNEYIHTCMYTNTLMSHLVRVLEKSVTLREFYYDKHVQELQSTIELQNNTISKLRDTIAGLNRREEIMENEHNEQELKIEKLRKRIAHLESSGGAGGADKIYEVDFSEDRHGHGWYDPRTREQDDKKYHKQNKCYDREHLCGMPYCHIPWSAGYECASCRAKLCYNHTHADYLVNNDTPTNDLFYQCNMCQDNKVAILECACLVCDKLYNPHDKYNNMSRIIDTWILNQVICENREWHLWVCEEHNNSWEMREAVKAKKYRCALCDARNARDTRDARDTVHSDSEDD